MNPLRVLVVEDDPSLRSVCVLLLRSRGFEVREAGFAAGAEQVLGEWTPGVILLDLTLPDAVGQPLLECIGRAAAHVPLVLFPADWLLLSELRSAPSVVAAIRKPCDFGALLGEISRAAAVHV